MAGSLFLWTSVALFGVLTVAFFKFGWAIWLVIPVGAWFAISALGFILHAPRPTPIQRATGRR